MKSKNIKKLLIVEDDSGLQKQLKWCFDGYEVHIAANREEAISLLRRHEPPIVTLDLGLPPDAENATEGLATLESILSMAPKTKVIVVTGNDDRENAIKAVAMGAYDYYQKPIDADILSLIVERAYNLYQLEEENRKLKSKSSSFLNGIIAASQSMLAACKTIEKVAPTDASTLILGDSGTGKELLANALHDLSDRKNNEFVAINCAAIPDNLLESELFGYEKGAFTGAVKQTRGKIEYADGGTLFLDEIGDMPLSLQAKLLRFLQERIIERIGGRKEIPVDVRIVCATHQDLHELIERKAFREDLFYRISEVVVKIPPLSERDGDVILIAREFLNQFNETHSKGIKHFSPDAIAALESYHWPGNVRELENKVKRAAIMAEGNTITADDLDLDIGTKSEQEPLNLKQVREEAEITAINHALTKVEGNVSHAAELLGVTRPTLYSLMQKYSIKGP